MTARVRGDAFLAVTTCSMKDGFWLWSQSLGGLGSKQDTPEPVLPISGRAQHEPRIEPTTGGELWLAWVEGEREADIGGVVRAARLDGSGKIVLGPFDLSDRGDSIALGSSLGDHLAIATTPDGGLVLAWLAIVGEHARGLRMRRIDAAGEAVTPILEATPEGHDRVDSPRLSVDDSGGVSLVWRRRAGGQSDRSGAAGQRVFFRAFTAEGEPRTDAIPFSIDEPERSQDLPRIASVGGRDLLVWTEARDLQEDGWIAVRRWLPGVGPVGLTTRFPASVAWQWPLLEALPDGDDGRFTIFWQPSGPNGFSEPGRLAWRSIDLTASFPGS